MTISVAWVRKVGSCEELIFASDSRLGGGVRWDECPKIFTLPRSDTAIAFAGNSHFAYPWMVQLQSAISSYSRSNERAMDIRILRGYFLKLLKTMANNINYEHVNRDDELAETEFLFGGYSWVVKRFLFWRIFYSRGMKMFQYEPARQFGHFGQAIFAGDWAYEGRVRLIKLLQSKTGKMNLLEADNTVGFNFEPFEILRDLLRNPLSPIDERYVAHNS